MTPAPGALGLPTIEHEGRKAILRPPAPSIFASRRAAAMPSMHSIGRRGARGKDNGARGPRGGEDAAHVLDPDGNNIEASVYAPALSSFRIESPLPQTKSPRRRGSSTHKLEIGFLPNHLRRRVLDPLRRGFEKPRLSKLIRLYGPTDCTTLTTLLSPATFTLDVLDTVLPKPPPTAC